MTAKTRAGIYIRQPSGYSAFHPAPLPPTPAIQWDGVHLNALLEAQASLARLDGITQFLPNPDLLVFMYVRAEAVLSSQIEGTQASLDDVLQAEANLKNPDAPGDVDEVINYIAALNHGLQRIESLPLSLRLIRELHGVLMQDTRGSQRDPGEFRRSQNWIGPAGSTLQNARYVPPPVPEMMNALDNLEKFIHDEQSTVPPLVRIGLIHAQFETIHPFLDGNGRLGRLLITFLMYHYRLLRVPLLYLSYHFKLNRSEYYDRLQAVRERGDWEGWLRFFLEGVRSVADESALKARAVFELREANRQRITDGLGRRTAKALVLHEHLLRQPYVTARNVEEITSQAYSNANSLIAALVEQGILEPLVGRDRDRVFAYQKYLSLFRIKPHGEISDPALEESTQT